MSVNPLFLENMPPLFPNDFVMNDFCFTPQLDDIDLDYNNYAIPPDTEKIAKHPLLCNNQDWKLDASFTPSMDHSITSSPRDHALSSRLTLFQQHMNSSSATTNSVCSPRNSTPAHYPLGTHSTRDFTTIAVDDPFSRYFPIEDVCEPLQSLKAESHLQLTRQIGVDSHQSIPLNSTPQPISIATNNVNIELQSTVVDPSMTSGVSPSSAVISVEQTSHIDEEKMTAMPSTSGVSSASSAAIAVEPTSISMVASPQTGNSDGTKYTTKYKAFLSEEICFKPNENAIKSWLCPFDDCNSGFKTQKSLILHYRKHTEYAYVCSFCNKRFGRRNNFLEHTRIHTNDRPFKCDYCPFACRQNHTLKDHVLVHKGEKPHHCSHCGKNFRVKHNLTQHFESVHLGAIFTCDQCGKELHSRQSLRRHIKTIHLKK